MDKIPLKNRIFRYLEHKSPEWIHSAEIERLAMQVGYKASNAGRRCRELAEAGSIQRKQDGKCVWYRYIQREVFTTPPNTDK